MTVDPIARFKKALDDGDAAALRQLFVDYPELKARINEPLFAFDSPAITYAAGCHTIEIIDVLLEAGADINARSSWWAGGKLTRSDQPSPAPLSFNGAALM